MNDPIPMLAYAERRSLAAIDEAWLRFGLEYWRRKCPQADLLPSRRDIDPIDLGRMLGRISILSVEPPASAGGPPVFRFRLRGGSYCSQPRGNPAGRTANELWPNSDYAARLNAHYLECLTERTPTYWVMEGRTTAPPEWGVVLERPIIWARILLPVADDHRTVTHLISCSVPRAGDPDYQPGIMNRPPTIPPAGGFALRMVPAA